MIAKRSILFPKSGENIFQHMIFTEIVNFFLSQIVISLLPNVISIP